jgi:four helix bundle protein
MRIDRRMKPPVRKHTDLIAWQLCRELRRLVLRYTRSGPAAKDYDYRYQLRKAARSACYNTSEGFYRYKHGQFGNHLNIARGSLGEVQDQLDEGLESKYFSEQQHDEMNRLCYRAMKANIALRQSWKGEAPGPLI